MEKDYNKIEFENVKKTFHVPRKQTKTENLLSMLYFSHINFLYTRMGGKSRKTRRTTTAIINFTMPMRKNLKGRAEAKIKWELRNKTKRKRKHEKQKLCNLQLKSFMQRLRGGLGCKKGKFTYTHTHGDVANYITSHKSQQ